MTLAVRVLSAGILTAGALLLPAAPAAAGQFHLTDTVDDFNCDGFRDEVYLADHYDVGDARAAGAIIVYLSTFEDVTLSQNTPGIPGTPETGDRFGATYASADFNGDGCDELIVGAPGEDRRAGMVVVIEGSPTGPDPSRAIAYTQDSPGVPGSSERGDEFGATLAAGATTSGQAYLLAGSPGEAIGSRTDAGSVYYLRGGTWRTFHQDSPGVAGTAEYGDRFGDTLASGDRHFVVGAPAENLSGRDYAGQIHVFDHRIVGGIPDPLATISQDSAGVSGTAEADDEFGRDVSIVSYRPSAGAAIGALVAVGVPGEDLGADDNAGMAHVLAVTPTGKVTE
ncbi:MAG TPA: FG-GAP repeat protein, partial [Phytomonospora sp.]